MRGSADASVADLTRYLARSVGYVPSRVSPVADVRVVRTAGYRAGRADRRTVVGMLVGAGVVVSFHACCRFFSHHRWDVDRIGLVLARLIVDRLLDAGAPIVVVVDDTLFRRWGPKVFGAFWTHDGSGQDPNALGRGNRWCRDPRPAAVLRASGVLAGAVTLARQGHRIPGPVGA